MGGNKGRNISIQINDAKDLASSKKLQDYFDEEVRGLENIFMGFSIDDGNYRDYQFQVNLPRMAESPYTLDIDVELGKR